MNLKEQLYVCTLAETGNLTQAANQLYISQPALSLYISNLENTLGMRLFERVGKQFVLTEVGEMYVNKASKMLEMKKEFDTELSELKNGQLERLRIGIQDIRSQAVIPTVLPKFTSMFPHTKTIWTEHNYDPLEQMLLDNQLDIFFCNCNTKRKDLEYIPLLNDELVFITSKDHPLIKHAEVRPGHTFPWIDLSLFQNERFILTGETQSLRKSSNQVLKSQNIVPKNIFILKKIFVIITLINQGYGVGFSMLGYLNWSKRDDNLAIFSVSDKPVTTTFYAVYKKGRHLTEAASSLIQLTEEAVCNHISPLYQYPPHRQK